MKKSLLLTAIIFLSLSACQSNQSSKPITEAAPDPSSHAVVVEEVLQVSGYTYLRVSENNTERWLATSPVEAKIGETYYYDGGFEMTNFKSKELDRTFESIFFLEAISAQPISGKKDMTALSPGATKAKEAKQEVKITAIEGGITIAEIYSNKDTYSGKTVKIKAEVTKFSPEIMNTNWIHLQDGTDFEGNFDLTITSDETVKEGDIVIIEGKVTIDKDLGFGYFFAVLIEDAKVIKQESGV